VDSGFHREEYESVLKVRELCYLLMVPSTRLQAEFGLQFLPSVFGAWVPDPSHHALAGKDLKMGKKADLPRASPFRV